jgi:sulfur carrier protein
MRATACGRLHPKSGAVFSSGRGVRSSVPTIVLNGESRAIQDGQTVAELLRELHLDPRQVAVERNREIVPRAEHGQVVLADADQLEIVTFVGGG